MFANEIEKINPEVVLPIVKDYLLRLQNEICAMVTAAETIATFHEDPWQHQSGGGGLTRVLTAGRVIEKAGVNFSHVQGETLPQAATLKRPELAGAKFQALGVSTVIHPHNPYIPTSHFNVRFILVTTASSLRWWFGGGFDLTPYFGFAEDAIHWHRMAKQACDPYGEQVYATYKKNCDDYFYLKHRQEARGIGGIFFDDLNHWGFDQCFAFMRSVGKHYIKAYQPILQRRMSLAYTEQEKQFQHYRRGRYVEFNLLYDRGTLFGLQSNGRVESILMSLPPAVAWPYQLSPEFEPAARQLQAFLTPTDWINFNLT